MSKMKLVPIDECTVGELRTFAQGALGIDVKSNSSLAQTRAIVEAAWDKDIPIAEAEPALQMAGEQPTPVTNDQRPADNGKVRINIGIQDEAGGSDPVPVGVNGKIMIIPRGKDVDIPEAYLEALSHAVAHKFDPLPDGLGINPEPREVKLYPFQIRGRVSDLDRVAA